MQERAGVKMVMIQDGPQNTGADKPLRISGEPFKVQVSCHQLHIEIVEIPWSSALCLPSLQECFQVLVKSHFFPLESFCRL